MKSKFFTLFAAFVLLFSANASAQVNGDVNDDGKVNEQDIAAILEIMAEAGGVKEQTKYYWYVGQTQPTADNYTTLEGIQQVTDYPTTFEYTNNSGKRGYAYVILHNSKTLTAVEKVSQATVNFTTDTSIPNYTIYKSTVGMAINGVMVITVNEKQTEDTKYYWYVGQTNPSTMTSISPIVDKASGKEGWRLIGNTVDTYTSTNKLSTGWVLQSLPDMTYMYIALPSTSSDTDLCPRDGFGNDGTTVGMYTRLTDKVINGVTYKIYKSTDDLLDAFGDDIF